MKKRILLLAAAVVGLLLAPSCRKTEVNEHFQIGERLPDFSVTTTDGKRVTTSDLKGKPSIVIIFTTTCPDCTAQLPEVETVFAAHKEDINVLAVNRGEKEDDVKACWLERGFTMPAAAPGDRSIYDLFDRGSQTGVPQVYISNPQGVIIGFTNDQKVLTSDDILDICKGK